jgi:hypothetical protein
MIYIYIMSTINIYGTQVGEMNTGTLPTRLGGSLKNRDNKLCSCVPWDSYLRKTALAMPGKTEKYRPGFSSERTPHINKPETV